MRYSTEFYAERDSANGRAYARLAACAVILKRADDRKWNILDTGKMSDAQFSELLGKILPDITD